LSTYCQFFLYRVCQSACFKTFKKSKKYRVFRLTLDKWTKVCVVRERGRERLSEGERWEMRKKKIKNEKERKQRKMLVCESERKKERH